MANLFAFFHGFLSTMYLQDLPIFPSREFKHFKHAFFIQLAENPDEIDLDDDDEDDEDDDEEDGGANGSNGNGDGGPIVERSVGKVEKQAIPAEVFGSLKKDDD